MTSNPLQYMLRPIYKIKESKTFTESLIDDFPQSSCNIAKFLFLEWTVCLGWTLETMSTLSVEIFLKGFCFLRFLVLSCSRTLEAISLFNFLYQ